MGTVRARARFEITLAAGSPGSRTWVAKASNSESGESPRRCSGSSGKSLSVYDTAPAAKGSTDTLTVMTRTWVDAGSSSASVSSPGLTAALSSPDSEKLHSPVCGSRKARKKPRADAGALGGLALSRISTTSRFCRARTPASVMPMAGFSSTSTFCPTLKVNVTLASPARPGKRARTLSPVPGEVIGALE